VPGSLLWWPGTRVDDVGTSVRSSKERAGQAWRLLSHLAVQCGTGQEWFGNLKSRPR
jgi:hypothetical protein